MLTEIMFKQVVTLVNVSQQYSEKLLQNKPEKNFGTSTGFKPVASALTLQCYEDQYNGSRPIC